MGQVTIIHRPSPPWNPETTELKRIFDVLFSSSYATGGDTMAAGEMAKLYQGVNGQTPGPYQHIKFDSELAKVCASGTLTSTGVNVTAADTVTIGSTTYTFRAAPAAANEVLIGASAAASLTNLRNALVQDTTVGYAAATVRNTEVRVFSVGATTLVIQARIAGVGGNINPVGIGATNYGNSIATTKVAVTLSWGAATLAGGVETGISVGFDVITGKFSLWNGNAQIANATDEHLLQARCELMWMLDLETQIAYGL